MGGVSRVMAPACREGAPVAGRRPSRRGRGSGSRLRPGDVTSLLLAAIQLLGSVDGDYNGHGGGDAVVVFALG